MPGRVRPSAIAQIFTEAQSSRISRKNAVLLKQDLLHNERFTQEFLSLLNRVLVLKKADANADRIIKLTALFVSVLDATEDEAEQELFGEFTADLVHHLLRGMESKEKNVRYRVVQLLAFIMSSGLSEIDEDLFKQLEKALIRRVRDREASVRVQAVLALSRFQADMNDEEEEVDEDEDSTKITEVMLHLLQHDPAAEVRRAVLHNLSQSPATLPFLLERARDLDPIMRKHIYTTVLPSIQGFKPLSISKRNKLLKWGLRDRDESVRKASEKMFAVDWLNLAHGSILELLQRLDIVNSTVGEDVMRAFFKIRKEFVDSIQFDEEFWQDLNPESVFLARCLNDQCTTEGIDLSDKLPELSELSELVMKQVQLALTQEDADKVDTEFVIENLLKIVQKSDFSDEIGRRRIQSTVHMILHAQLSDNVQTLAVNALSKIAVNEVEYVSIVREVVTDLYDELEDDPEEASFHSAESGTPNGKEETSGEVKYILTTLRALNLVHALILNLTGTLASNPKLTEVLSSIIHPAVRSHEGPIRERGIECLSLICLLDKKTAEENMDLFIYCFAKGHEEMRILAIRIVTDILMAHPALLKTVIASTDEEEAEQSSPEEGFVRMFLKAFENDDFPEVQATAALSVSKLLLHNILLPDSVNARGLLKEMATLYYSPASFDNQSLKQCLAYFFPVYCYSSAQHQEAFATVVVSVMRRVSRQYEELDAEERQEMAALTSVGAQLMEWTNPLRLANLPAQSMDSVQACQVVHIAPGLLKRLGVCKKEEGRVLASMLGKVHLPRRFEQEQIETAVEDLDDVLERCSDMVTKRSLVRFKAAMDKALASQDSETVVGDGDKTSAAADEEDTATVNGDVTAAGDITVVA
ncbi:nuclear condensing complex subunit [Protomyces lactucae-debilis]|uniref:Nuclear condensing complex subunit n=1 Tax=Protomyces lactucae-debilis TaxID=2754530 RepID=A0A1Y2FH18_PROLT|nr:nuclear condensing complex subunit [Protomyces lactucae-debilis]ORY82105.1 nuclear condensing complex subunit [Protomyces lactucae-debilis]